MIERVPVATAFIFDEFRDLANTTKKTVAQTQQKGEQQEEKLDSYTERNFSDLSISNAQDSKQVDNIGISPDLEPEATSVSARTPTRTSVQTETPTPTTILTPSSSPALNDQERAGIFAQINALNMERMTLLRGLDEINAKYSEVENNQKALRNSDQQVIAELDRLKATEQELNRLSEEAVLRRDFIEANRITQQLLKNRQEQDVMDKRRQQIRSALDNFEQQRFGLISSRNFYSMRVGQIDREIEGLLQRLDSLSAQEQTLL